MINSIDRVLEGACASLRQVIIPALDGDHLRSQAFGVVQALEGLRLVVDRALPPLAEQVAIQEAGIAEASSLLAGSDAPAWRPSGPVADGAAALRVRDRGEAFIGTLLRFLAERGGELPAGTVRDAEAILHRTMRDQLAVEIRLVPKPDFTAISSGREADPTR